MPERHRHNHLTCAHNCGIMQLFVGKLPRAEEDPTLWSTFQMVHCALFDLTDSPILSGLPALHWFPFSTHWSHVKRTQVLLPLFIYSDLVQIQLGSVGLSRMLPLPPGHPVTPPPCSCSAFSSPFRHWALHLPHLAATPSSTVVRGQSLLLPASVPVVTTAGPSYSAF